MWHLLLTKGMHIGTSKVYSKLIQNKKIKALFPSDARRMEGYQVCHHRKYIGILMA